MTARQSRTLGISLGCALFLLNYYVCRELFGIEWLDHMGSIEGAYIGISRWVMSHWRDLTWFPLWYGGIPYQDTYPPFLHWMVALDARVMGLSAARAHHWVTALAYCAGPVTVYALVARLSKSRWTGFTAGLIYSTCSFSAWLIPAYATDIGGWMHSRRLQTMVSYGDGPHVAALTLLPLAILFLDLALERSWIYVSLAAIFFAATALTNWLGAFALAIATGCYLLARARLAWRVICVGALAYALAMPWIPPSTIGLIRSNSARVGGDFSRIYAAWYLWLPLLLAAIALLHWAIRRLAPALRFAILFAAILCAIVLGAVYFGLKMVPQPDRYHLELEMALAILIALLGQVIFRKQWMGAAAIVILVAALILPVESMRAYALLLMRPIDITTTVEYQVGQWLAQNGRGQRVMAPGSVGYWLAAFGDSPEMNGGFDQGVTNWMVQVASYEIGTDDGAGSHAAEYSILWLKAMGVHAVVVDGDERREFYHSLRNPGKFAGALPEAGRAGGDIIYRVGACDCFAQVVPGASIVSRAPINAIDVDPLRAYAAALDDAARSPVEWRWVNQHTALARADFAAGDVLTIPISWHFGWRAKLDGQDAEVRRDALGFLYVAPGAAGGHEIELRYDGGFEMRAAKMISMTALALLIGLPILDLRKRESAPIHSQSVNL